MFYFISCFHAFAVGGLSLLLFGNTCYLSGTVIPKYGNYKLRIVAGILPM